MIDIRSLGKNWNDAAVRRLADLQERRHSHVWQLLGMLGIGLVAGAALGGYAVSQRSQLKRLVAHASRIRNEIADNDGSDDQDASTVTSTRSNHRRKATAEV